MGVWRVVKFGLRHCISLDLVSLMRIENISIDQLKLRNFFSPPEFEWNQDIANKIINVIQAVESFEFNLCIYSRVNGDSITILNSSNKTITVQGKRISNRTFVKFIYCEQEWFTSS